MSGVGAALSKKVGPMPMGAWLLVGAGGLFIAYRGSQHDAAAPAAAPGDALPTGGGYGDHNTFDGAPLVMSPIINVAPAPVKVVTPTPTQTPTPKPTPAKPPVIAKPAPAKKLPVKPAPKATSSTYTVRSGDTLWSIAAAHLGSGLRWTKLYADNKSTIEAAARKHGRSSSANGHWIYPGTKLVVKK